MGYTADNPPRFVRPLLDEYDVSVEECGYNGSWAKIRLENGQAVQFRREVTNDVSIKGVVGPQIKTHVSSRDHSNVAERDELVGEALYEVLSGFETLHEAIDAQ